MKVYLFFVVVVVLMLIQFSDVVAEEVSGDSENGEYCDLFEHIGCPIDTQPAMMLDI